MSESIVALLFDFDGTLAPDSTTFLLKRAAGFTTREAEGFWDDVTDMVEDGWDPPIAYMTKLLDLSGQGILDLSVEGMRHTGGQLEPYEGLPEMFEELQEMVDGVEEFCDAGVKLQYWIVSGGLEEIIRGNKIADHVNGGIFGCTFRHHEETGAAIGIKSAVSFTEKTKFLFGINKGFSERELRSKPYLINDAMEPDDRPVSINHMVYVGDGPSDIPCFSIVYESGGNTIGIRRKRSQKGQVNKGYEIARGERTTQGPYWPKYSQESDMRAAIEDSIKDLAGDVVVIRRERRVRGPEHE